MTARYNAPKTRTVIDTGTLGRRATLFGARSKIPSESLPAFMLKYLQRLARPERFELPTPRFVVWCSIQLSYGRAGPLKGCESES
jgi:hypothetical protein